MAIRTWSAVADGNWSLAANWDGGLSVPATTDAIVFDATSVKNCTIDNVGTWSGGTLTIDAGYATGVITKSVAIVTAAYSQAGGTFNGGSTAMTSTTVALSGGTLTATSGTWTITGNFTKTNSPTFTANGGTIACTGAGMIVIDAPSLTFNKFTVNMTGSVWIQANTTFPLGANPTTTTDASGSYGIVNDGTITVSGTWNCIGGLRTDGNGVISGALATFNLTNGVLQADAGGFPSTTDVTVTTSGTSPYISCAGATLQSVTVLSSSAADVLTFYGSNSIGTFTDTAAVAAHILEFEDLATQTFGAFTVTGASGKITTLRSFTNGVAYTLHTTGGTVTCDYLSVKDSTVDASPAWYAGSHSTNVSGNTNWIFSDPTPPVTTTGVTGRRVRQSATTSTPKGERVRQSA